MVAKSLLDIQKDRIVVLAGADTTHEVGTLIPIVTNLSEGQGPKHHEVNDYSAFIEMCLKRMENFYRHEVTKDIMSALQVRKEYVYGREALKL